MHMKAENKVRCVMKLDEQVWEQSKAALYPISRSAFIEATLKSVVDLKEKPFESLVGCMIDDLGKSLVHTKPATKNYRRIRKTCNK